MVILLSTEYLILKICRGNMICNTQETNLALEEWFKLSALSSGEHRGISLCYSWKHVLTEEEGVGSQEKLMGELIQSKISSLAEVEQQFGKFQIQKVYIFQSGFSWGNVKLQCWMALLAAGSF